MTQTRSRSERKPSGRDSEGANSGVLDHFQHLGSRGEMTNPPSKNAGLFVRTDFPTTCLSIKMVWVLIAGAFW